MAHVCACVCVCSHQAHTASAPHGIATSQLPARTAAFSAACMYVLSRNTSGAWACVCSNYMCGEREKQEQQTQ